MPDIEKDELAKKMLVEDPKAIENIMIDLVCNDLSQLRKEDLLKYLNCAQ
jgi:hypothetical protein